MQAFDTILAAIYHNLLFMKFTNLVNSQKELLICILIQTD